MRSSLRASNILPRFFARSHRQHKHFPSPDAFRHTNLSHNSTGVGATSQTSWLHVRTCCFIHTIADIMKEYVIEKPSTQATPAFVRPGTGSRIERNWPSSSSRISHRSSNMCLIAATPSRTSPSAVLELLHVGLFGMQGPDERGREPNSIQHP